MSQSLQVSLLIPAKSSSHAIENTVTEAHRFLSRRFGAGNFEILVIPTSVREGVDSDPSARVAGEVAARYPATEVRVVPHYEPVGKGAALRTGFLASHGQWIFFTDGDLPYDLEFFERAGARLKDGYSLVTGNRRLMTSFFHMPVDLLRLAYKRHRLGLLFNRVVRWLLPIGTTDTQAGIKAMTRELATHAFRLQRSPGFFFDLELFLTARGQGLAQTELPVRLHLRSEKSTVRIIKEAYRALYWLGAITLAEAQGHYGRPPRRVSVAQYPGTGLGTRIFLWLRWTLTPYARMAAQLPMTGQILDIGSGHGLFSIYLAQESGARHVIGLDHDPARVNLARQAGLGLKNLSFTDGSLLGGKLQGELKGPWNGIALIDVLHYLPEDEQKRVIDEAYAALAPGGILIAREVEPDAGPISSWNRLYERLATTIGFTRSEGKSRLHFRTRRGWESFFRQRGFTVRSQPCSHFLFADILYVCEKPA